MQTLWSKAFQLCAATGCDQQLSLQLDPASGAIVSFVNVSHGASAVNWASAAKPLARYVYRSRSHEASNRFIEKYLWDPTVYWAPRAFQKVGLNTKTVRDANETTTYAKIVAMKTNATSAVIDLQPPAFTSDVYGGPQTARLGLHFQSAEDGLSIALIAVNKTTTRL